MYGEASEVLVAEHTILGERRKDKVSIGSHGIIHPAVGHQSFRGFAERQVESGNKVWP